MSFQKKQLIHAIFTSQLLYSYHLYKIQNTLKQLLLLHIHPLVLFYILKWLYHLYSVLTTAMSLTAWTTSLTSGFTVTGSLQLSSPEQPWNNRALSLPFLLTYLKIGTLYHPSKPPLSSTHWSKELVFQSINSSKDNLSINPSWKTLKSLHTSLAVTVKGLLLPYINNHTINS